MSKFKGLKAGDSVWVVAQKPRRRPARSTGQDTFLDQGPRTITRVGRKYGYFEHHQIEHQFCLDDGTSHHGSQWTIATRANGRGFDVYKSQQEFVRIQHEQSEARRLVGRLTDGRQAWFRKLPPEAVERIHEVLDMTIGKES